MPENNIEISKEEKQILEDYNKILSEDTNTLLELQNISKLLGYGQLSFQGIGEKSLSSMNQNNWIFSCDKGITTKNELRKLYKEYIDTNFEKLFKKKKYIYLDYGYSYIQKEFVFSVINKNGNKETFNLNQAIKLLNPKFDLL